MKAQCCSCRRSTEREDIQDQKEFEYRLGWKMLYPSGRADWPLWLCRDCLQHATSYVEALQRMLPGELKHSPLDTIRSRLEKPTNPDKSNLTPPAS